VGPDPSDPPPGHAPAVWQCLSCCQLHQCSQQNTGQEVSLHNSHFCLNCNVYIVMLKHTLQTVSIINTHALWPQNNNNNNIRLIVICPGLPIIYACQTLDRPKLGLHSRFLQLEQSPPETSQLCDVYS